MRPLLTKVVSVLPARVQRWIYFAAMRLAIWRLARVARRVATTGKAANEALAETVRLIEERVEREGRHE